ncbi:MAG: hypothetical protein GXX79_22255 [Actinomycetales bacterium]|nr:hypothetical protein [Actinomycetales bacterium]
MGEAEGSGTAGTRNGRVVGWSLLLPPGWWHVPVDERRNRSLSALLDRVLSSLPRDRIALWRHELTAQLTGFVEQAAERGASDVYLLADLRRGLPLAASCLATILPFAPPDDAPAIALAHALADRDGDEPGVLTVGDRTCARIRRREPGTGLPEPGTATAEDYARALPTTRLEVYLPFPDGGRMLLLSFSTSVEPVADAMVTLFEAMAESLRWRWE